MPQCRGSRAFAFAFIVLALTSPLPAQEPLRLGGEFQVNAYTTGNQSFAAVSRGVTGFVVVWIDASLDGSSNGVFARRFDSSGAQQGADLQVNTYTTGNQRNPSVARLDNGGFVVVWESADQDGSYNGVFAQRFTSDGTRVGGELLVNTQTDGSQVNPAIDAAADGRFVVVWSRIQFPDDVFGQRFSAAGTPIGGEFRANAFTSLGQNLPDVAVADNADFVVVWQSDAQDGANAGVFARRFTSAGVAGVETQVNTYTPGNQIQPSVAIDGDGEFVVAWADETLGGNTYAAILTKRFNVLGAAIGVELQVNASTANDQRQPDVAMDGAGRLIVAWSNFLGDGDASAVHARYVDEAGSPGGEFQVNSYTAGSQGAPSAAAAGDGDFVIAWHSAQDGDGYGVFAQRLTRPKVLDVDGNGRVAALTDGILVLRFLFGFTGTTLTSGAVGDGCARCDAVSIEPYLQGLV